MWPLLRKAINGNNMFTQIHCNHFIVLLIQICFVSIVRVFFCIRIKWWRSVIHSFDVVFMRFKIPTLIRILIPLLFIPSAFINKYGSTTRYDAIRNGNWLIRLKQRNFCKIRARFRWQHHSTYSFALMTAVTSMMRDYSLRETHFWRRTYFAIKSQSFFVR